MKPGIVLMAELRGAIAERLLEIQTRYDPRMVAELPPHVTINEEFTVCVMSRFCQLQRHQARLGHRVGRLLTRRSH